MKKSVSSGVSLPKRVYKHLRAIEERGFLKIPGASKTCLELMPLHSGPQSIPFLGTVAAGVPIEAIEIPESIEVPESFLGNGNNFALRVRGDSMIEEGIREGDILIVAKKSHAESGQTVVALVRGEATVKKFYYQGGEVELRLPTANAAYPSSWNRCRGCWSSSRSVASLSLDGPDSVREMPRCARCRRGIWEAASRATG